MKRLGGVAGSRSGEVEMVGGLPSLTIDINCYVESRDSVGEIQVFFVVPVYSEI